MIRKDHITITPLLKDHWKHVKRIYQQGIETGVSTFEKEIPGWSKWDAAHIAEVSIYIDPSFHRQGIGSLLLDRLISSSEEQGLWTLQAGIFSENTPSVNLHSKLGFRLVGIREKLGKIHNQWKDIILMERRSKKVGID